MIKGLFCYYDFPVKQRTNSPMEQKFGREKAVLYSRCKRKNFGDQVRLRGDYLLKQIYVGKEEIKEHLNMLGESFSQEQIKEGLKELQVRHTNKRDL